MYQNRHKNQLAIMMEQGIRKDQLVDSHNEISATNETLKE